MINLEILDKQHITIITEINSIMSELEKGSTSMDTAAAALHISKLAGTLRIHLMQEDKFLYPGLKQSADPSVRELAEHYITEMGHLAETYRIYKDKYNTKIKITGNIHEFITESRIIMDTLKVRMAKEDNELYRIIRERHI